MHKSRLGLLSIVLIAHGAGAQTIAVHSIDSNSPSLGTIVSSSTGDSVFRISSADGSVIRISGTAVRLGTGSARALVTFTCSGDENACLAASATVTLSAAGSPTGRAGPMSNFTVASGPNPPMISAVVPGASATTFQVSGIPAGATRNVYLGADIGIQGDDGGATGTATSGFSVSVAANTLFGQAEANVIRPINLAKHGDLSFGAILRPTIGTSSVTVSAADGLRSLVGGNGAIVGSGAARATYSVTGEGGQIVSVSVPDSFTMSGPADLEVVLDSSAGATNLLSATPGSAGSFGFGVGGTISVTSETPPGHYVGTFQVTVQYN